LHFVTDEYLAGLRPATNAADTDNITGITDVWVADNEPYFHIEVLSDIRIGEGGGASPPSGYSVDEANVLRTGLIDRVMRLRSAFRLGRPADLLVSCGDLVIGPRDASQPELRRVESAYSDVCIPAFQSLREGERTEGPAAEVAGRPAELLVVPGDEDTRSGRGSARSPWPDAEAPGAGPYYSQFAGKLAAGSVPPDPTAHPVVALFRIRSRDQKSTARLGIAPLAYFAVVGFDSNDASHKLPILSNYGQVSEAQLEWARRLVGTLQADLARSTPLYVIAVTHHNLLPVEDRLVHSPRGAYDERMVRLQQQMQDDPASASLCEPLPQLCIANHLLAENALGGTSNATGLLGFCDQVRASLVLHSNMHQRVATTLVSRPLVAGQPARELAVVAAPAIATGRPTSGMARLRLNLWKGQAEITFYHDTAPDGGTPSNPIQIVSPLISASRVSTSERRLYNRMSGLVARALADGLGDAGEIHDFADYAATVWEDHGYVPSTFADGQPPSLGTATRFNRYYILLLLRETVGGNYEILLSRHNPLRPNEFAEWDTLLMPAFSSVRDLMTRLHGDVIRQVVMQAEDMDRASSARSLDTAVELIQRGGGNLQDDIWLDKIRDLGTINKVKVSPTTGQITDYEYRLVVLTPFVRDLRSVDVGAITDDEAKRQLFAERDVVAWLSELPSMQLPGAPLRGRQLIPMEAIMSCGSGLRWEPAADPLEAESAGYGDSRRTTSLPPGAVWFPLSEIGDPEVPWTLVPSIVARNADVMRWIDRELAKRRTNGVFPPQMVLGQMNETVGYSLAEGPFPFAQPTDCDGAETGLATSTVEAMNRVEYNALFDLRGQRPYLWKDIRRVALVRRSIRLRSGSERDVILVFDAQSMPGAGAALSHFTACPADRDNGLLGVLRPAQRYVMESGLERAGWVNDFLAEKCADDPWGFLRARFGEAGEPIALTPPIVEQVHADDWDSDDENMIEFVVCDGNHRVVQKVWSGNAVAAAIGVIGPPREPYYTRPFSPYEWDITAESCLSVAPDPRFRYAPRKVDTQALNLSEDARRELEGKRKDQLYRRYYRDLERGFGPMGGQGGRYA